MKMQPKSAGVNKENYTEDELKDIKYMKAAIGQAKKAYALGEVPIGCVIVYEDKIIGRGYNRRNTDKTPLAHAEITAIRKAGKVIKDWRLEGCKLYVTLEPCQMCAGAIVQARIPEVIMAAVNPKAGCAGFDRGDSGFGVADAARGFDAHFGANDAAHEGDVFDSGTTF